MALVLSVSVSGDLWAASSSNPVEVEGDRLSVHAEGMGLGDLLMAVEDMTGVQFTFDELLATEEIFLDFKGLTLLEGLRKIIYPLSYAAIYDDKGKLRRVIILGQWKGSGMEVHREEASDSPGGPAPSLSEAISFRPKEGLDNSSSRKRSPSKKRPIQFDDALENRERSMDGPPGQHDQVTEGPPLDKPYSVDGPPKTQNEKLTGHPDAESTDHLTPADFGGSPTDGPPLDWKYEVDGPPGWEN